MSRIGWSPVDGSCMDCMIPDPTRGSDVIVFAVGNFTLRLCVHHARRVAPPAITEIAAQMLRGALER